MMHRDMDTRHQIMPISATHINNTTKFDDQKKINSKKDDIEIDVIL